MKFSNNPLIILFMALFLSGCIQVSLGKNKQTKVKHYLLAPNFHASKGKPVAENIVVEMPKASMAYNTQSISVLLAGDEPKKTFARRQKWALPLPNQLQNMITKALQKQNFQNIETTYKGENPTYILISDIKTFQIIYKPEEGLPRVQVKLRIHLLKLPENNNLDEREFSITLPVPENKFSSIIETFEAALKKILPEIAVWVRESL